MQGFAKTMLRLDELEEDKLKRYLGLIDTASDELADLLDLLSLAARIEGGRYEPVTREADSLELAPAGATGTGAIVIVDPEPVERSLARSARAAARHGGTEVKVTVDGPRVSSSPSPRARPRSSSARRPRTSARRSPSCSSARSAARSPSTASGSPSRCRAERDRLPAKSGAPFRTCPRDSP